MLAQRRLRVNQDSTDGRFFLAIPMVPGRPFGHPANRVGQRLKRKSRPAGYETYKSGNRMMHEQWAQPACQDAMGDGQYAITVGQRYAVQAIRQVADIDMLRSAVASVDLAKLESLKNEGIRAK
jgi:hypothetical protein